MQFHTGDGQLSHAEFIKVLKSRISRGLDKVRILKSTLDVTIVA